MASAQSLMVMLLLVAFSLTAAPDGRAGEAGRSLRGEAAFPPATRHRKRAQAPLTHAHHSSKSAWSKAATAARGSLLARGTGSPPRVQE
jgi:hypothetical protein